jgi:hypothetical protein
LSTLHRRLLLSVHPDIVDKDVSNNRLYSEGWKNVELTPEDLAHSIKDGHPYCVQLLYGYRDKQHFMASDIASLDIDSGMSIAEALEIPIVRDHATILYTTVRHQPETPRFRIIFVLPRTITDAKEMETVLRALHLRVGAGDRNTLDAAHMFFGNRQAELMLFDREISSELLAELIAQGQNPPEPGTLLKGEKGAGRAPSRSRLVLKPDQEIGFSNGAVVSFSELTPGRAIRCPFHHDEHPSAFVVTSRHGINGIHCSACACTYWPEGVSSPEDVFDSFEKAVREAAAYYEAHQDYGPLAPILGLPEHSGGLTGKAIHIVDGYPAPPELWPGVVMVKSPKGTGKTRRLGPLLANSRSVLLIGHRQALIRQSCTRLNLHCYLDNDGKPNVEQYPRYGICLDSLGKIPPNSRFDVVVLDESEQVLAHFLSDTMDRGEGSRDRVFHKLRHLVRQAKTVIALDADLGWVTFRTLSRMGERKDKHLWLNEAEPAQGKSIQIFDSEPHLVAELKQAIDEGKRCFVASNSKTKMENLSAAVEEQFPRKKVILVTADTAQKKDEVRKFVADPAASAASYDVVFASPSIGTGVDITFPEKAQMFDVVFGFCEARITTHLEFDQQLARVRHPGAVKVWVNPRRFHFETEFDVVRRDALERSLFKSLLIGYADTGEAEYQENDLFLEMASLILSEQRASKNNLKANFIRHKERQGFHIGHVRRDEDQIGEGRGLLARGRQLNEEEYCQTLLSSETLTEAEFIRVRNAIVSGEVVSARGSLAYERTALERFYGRPATAELIRLDDRGRFRATVKLFEGVFETPDLTELNFHTSDRRRLVPTESSKAATILTLLRRTPLLKKGCLNCEAVFQQSDLDEFTRTLLKDKTWVETHLGIEVRRDVTGKPVQQFGRILKLLGLKLEPFGAKKRKGQKVYQYRLAPESLAKMKAIVEARKPQGQRHLAGRLFGSAEACEPNDEKEGRG